ncbi:acyltransferase family protein [Natronoglycomyces albus]|uniref:Acyltransferase n=1 Tax=Natronoglycomyces albus TaxID=2811108 RepID=A0A895XRX5_9ACTN|nr:acyltransferase family protein [Natronoglycomyces albus]QSB06089.1 acyltransferase [Natronoglycomyces albus]
MSSPSSTVNNSSQEPGSQTGSVLSNSDEPRLPTQRAPEGIATPKRFHIPEIEGLRGIAIVLIVIFHVWFNRVSGGVDVFFLLSGFLITLSLIRAAERPGGTDIGRYLSRLVRRITPPALIVLAGVVVMAIIWLPKSRWGDTFGDVLSSAFFIANWRLAENSVDYLASQNSASMVQHYWSLGVQAQFYLLWPLVISAAILAVKLLGDRVPGLTLRRAAAVTIGLVFVASFAWSLHQTATDQTYAYFDTRARLWEFALGGLLFLALPYLRCGRRWAAILAWLGIAALVSCGIVFTGAEFPGFAALVPTLGGAAIIAAAVAQPHTTAGSLLRSAPLQRLGQLSFSLYLWHWPVLVTYLVMTGEERPGLLSGLGIVAVSILLAQGTHLLLEVRLPATGIGQKTVRGGFALGATCLVVVMLAVTAWFSIIEGERKRIEALSADAANYPGAQQLANTAQTTSNAPLIPSFLDAHLDDELELRDECSQNIVGKAVKFCELGSEDPEYTIAIIGASKTWQWVPAFLQFHEEHNWRIIPMTKNACHFSAYEQIYRGEVYEDCNEWNDRVMDELAQLRPDAVFATANRVDEHGEYTDEGYIARWEQLDDMGIDVFAIRDTPRPGFDVPECVEANGITSLECARDRDDIYPLQEPEVATEFDVPDNVRFIDLIDYVCGDQVCPPVVGNILVYQDTTHITATYMRTLAPYLEAELVATIDGQTG